MENDAEHTDATQGKFLQVSYSQRTFGAAASWSYLVVGSSNTCSFNVLDSQLLWLENMCA
jgi:hypothetical protein